MLAAGDMRTRHVAASFPSLKEKGRKLDKQLRSCLLVMQGNDVKAAEASREDIASLLLRLGELVEALSAAADDDAKQHTYHRYMALLGDYEQEYKRASRTLDRNLQRVELMTRESDRDMRKGRSGIEDLLEEQTSLIQSMRGTDDALEMAKSSHESALRQGARLRNARTGVLGIASEIPLVNSVITRIERLKKRDMIILSLTMAICMFFIILYWVNK